MIDGKDTIPPGFGTWCLSGSNIKIKGSQQIFIEGFQNSRELGTCARRGTKMAAGLEAEMALYIYITIYIVYPTQIMIVPLPNHNDAGSLRN